MYTRRESVVTHCIKHCMFEFRGNVYAKDLNLLFEVGKFELRYVVGVACTVRRREAVSIRVSVEVLCD